MAVALTTEPPPPAEAEPRLAPAPTWDDEPRLTAMDRLARSPAVVPGGGMALRIAWIASVVVLLLLGWGAYEWRSDVMRVWPPSIRAYEALGLAAR